MNRRFGLSDNSDMKRFFKLNCWGKELRKKVKYMANILDQYEPMYFQIDRYEEFLAWNFKILEFQESGESILSYKEVLC